MNLKRPAKYFDIAWIKRAALWKFLSCIGYLVRMGRACMLRMGEF